MKKLLNALLVCSLFLGFIENVNGQNLTSEQRAIIERQIDSHFHEMIKAAENLDYDKITTGVDDKNNAGFITNGSYYEKYDSLFNILKARPQDGSKQSITIKKEKISVLSESFALLTAFGDAKVDLSSGNSYTVKFLWSFVYEKIDNNWKVIQSHQSGSR